MDELTSDFGNCLVKFGLDSGEYFSIVPRQYLDFNHDDAPASNLISAEFELTSEEISRRVGDCIYVNAFVELRNFLANANTAKIGENLDFSSEEKVVAMRFIRQEETLRISGQTPTDEYPSVYYSGFQDKLKTKFETQVHFYCNFPLHKVLEVVDQMDRILQIIGNQGVK